MADTAAVGARQMFNSLQRFKQLPDYLQVWPGHGAGSACGKGLGAIPSSTVGYEKLFNGMLQYDDEAEFVEVLLAGQPEPPKYFAMMKRINKEGAAILNGIPVPAKQAAADLTGAIAEAIVVDTRSAEAFAAGHIAGTINIPHNGSFTNWAGWFMPYDKPFYVITAESNIDTLTRDLISIGLDNIAGYFDLTVLDGTKLQSYKVAQAAELADSIAAGKATLVDVRNQTEWDEGHIPQAKHIMLGYLTERVTEVPIANGYPVVVQCRTGARSAIAASILQANGVENVINMMGGITEWEADQLPLLK
jgi:hydroxyacylglutathione hydrolase